MQRPRNGGAIADHRRALLFYIFITFVLMTISFAANAKYTEMIWIDLRDIPGGPLTLIQNELDYSINVLALSTGHIQEWFMQALLLHRCFVIWNWARSVIIPMTTLYIAMIVMSILVQIQASTGAIWYNIDILLVYLCIEVGLTVIYTILVAYRLLSMRTKMKQAMTQYDSSTYDIVIRMVIESAVSYSIFAVLFIIAFALHSDGVSTLCFLSIGQVQGIAQLFIIIRVARGRAVTREWSTRAAAPTTLEFSGTVWNAAEGTDDGLISRPQQDVVRVYPTSTEGSRSV
jgi:hypothetical protein